jgi:hypothetical protein
MRKTSWHVIVAAIAALSAACASSTAGRGRDDQAASRFGDVTDLVIADSSEARPVTPGRFLKYPPDAKAKGIEGGFASVFVVDTAGRVEYRTVSFTADAPPELRDAVCSYLHGLRLTPVVRDGHVRRALVVTPWLFGLEGGRWMGQRYDVSPLRRAISSEGIGSTVSRLESQPHCH